MTPSTIVLGADHAGFELKETLKKTLTKGGWEVEDLAPAFQEGDDYPLVAKQVAKRIIGDSTALGILVCGTGLGMDIAANRYKGVRATVVRTVEEAALSREHNHANVLILGGRVTGGAKAKAIVETWLKTPYSRAARHLRRVHLLDV